MAHGVYKRAGSPFWWIWYGAGEKRTMESSGQRRDDPLGWKHAFDLARTRAGGAPLAANSTRKGDWDVWVDAWIASLFPDPKQATTKRINLVHWRFIRAFLETAHVLNPASLTYAVAQEYVAWRTVTKRKASYSGVHAAKKEIDLLRRVMGEAVRRGFVAANPVAELRVKTPRHKEKPEITAEQEAVIRRALLAKEGHLPVTERWMTMSFLWGIRHGWRIAETSFPLSRVNFETFEVLVHSKGNKWRTVPIHPELRPILLELRAAGATMSCVFPGKGAAWASLAWCQMLNGSERFGIKGLFQPPVHITHHCCRVSVISRLARAKVPPKTICEFVGHWSSATNWIYLRVAHGDLAQCIFPDAPASVSPPNPSPQTLASV